MPSVEVDLKPEEEVLRVFFRLPSQEESFDKIQPGDFARRMAKESGISMFRLALITPQEALARVPSKSLRGIAIAKADELQHLGLRFLSTSDTEPHVSVRCAPCKLVPALRPLCSAGNENCWMDYAVSLAMLRRIAQQFKVGVKAQARDSLRSVR